MSSNLAIAFPKMARDVPAEGRPRISSVLATSLAAPAIVLRSRVMLRPLVSVPPIDGNLASNREVSPT